MGQITRICKNKFVFLSIYIFFFIFLPKLVISNDYGRYLSWSYARQNSDFEHLENLYSFVDFKSINKSLLEEILFQSIVFDNWKKAKEISEELSKRDQKNFSANLFNLVDNYLNKKNVTKNIKNIDPEYFELSFLKALILWTDQDSEVAESASCIPLLCMHYGIKLMVQGKKKQAMNYLTKLDDKKFTSTRVLELLFLAYSKTKDFEKAKIKIDSLSFKDANLKKYTMQHLVKNNYLLNPVNNEKDGLAETFYNISSWYYQKNLFKYSVFFGKLSLRLRPNFNAMKMLLLNAYDQLDYHRFAIKLLTNLNKNNPYFMKLIKIKSTFYEKFKDNEDFISELEKISNNFPNNWEVRLLLADKYRNNKEYNASINLYTSVINNEIVIEKWPVLYSRGIAYERLNKWNQAEIDFKEALKLNPKDPYILNYLAYSWLDRNINLKKAVNFLEKAVELEPSDGYILDSLGWAYYLTGQIEKSIYYLEKAVSIMPNDATLNDHLGDALWKSGRKLEGISQWKRVLIIEPQYKNKKKIKQKIESGIN